jgi:hypothetical protein
LVGLLKTTPKHDYKTQHVWLSVASVFYEIKQVSYSTYAISLWADSCDSVGFPNKGTKNLPARLWSYGTNWIHVIVLASQTRGRRICLPDYGHMEPTEIIQPEYIKKEDDGFYAIAKSQGSFTRRGGVCHERCEEFWTAPWCAKIP